ncbi:aminodeoxychorismate synthase [Nocardiopsis gilva YIM 90087]|uniref:aminodeoxychorismate synthase n=1 Tax=Nocardiopsis gilva YIM 90087 TaxID=1235441 RepID=A0A223S792_9ACTN|nr:aminodeoxychorismate synthase component I [Nocardiopsis gilva]ASU83976.1 aminodeoxychorismate synthase [Nocardiopsis gilva YIM 90087]
MRVLLVDNHDSYTYNLFQLIAGVLGTEPVVVTNDDPRWAEIDPAAFDAAVVSPGPGRPQHARDLGRVPQVLADPRLPVLGVCLGHQAIAYFADEPVHSAPVPRHGHLSPIRHTGTGLFAGIPQGFTAVRYHSLAVPDPLQDPLTDLLTATAWAEDDVVMGLEHRSLPRWGVQFHPESVASEYGRGLIANFAALARDARSTSVRLSAEGRAAGSSGVAAMSETRRESAAGQVTEIPVGAPDTPIPVSEMGGSEAQMSETSVAGPQPQSGEVRFRTLSEAVDTERAFAHLFAASPYAFWLDSSRVGGTARFSFLGNADGPESEVLTYRVGEGTVSVAQDGDEHHEPGTIFEALRRRVAVRPHGTAADLPFDFVGGYVGFFGYELKADCGGQAAHQSAVADAVWMRCTRFIAVDHVEGRTYVVSVGDAAADDAWLDSVTRDLADLPPLPLLEAPSAASGSASAEIEWESRLERPREGYLTDVKECLGHLVAGESYEICLTNRVRLPAPADDLAFYRRLRRSRPAPYAALLRLGETSVFSASPERFLRIDAEGVADSRPIKGTAPRGADPAADQRLAEELRTGAKTRAENLMIVDLLRNDLGRVCEVGSVDVPAFMYTESYATVHQLVSTVRGRLRPDVAAVDAVRACFPGGSMTGAPKLRTMEIIDDLESSARGVYSGALGYVSFGGTTDLSIVIRTAVRSGTELEIGAGGAIVLDSDPEDEYAEMLLKAAVPAAGLRGAVGVHDRR